MRGRSLLSADGLTAIRHSARETRAPFFGGKGPRRHGFFYHFMEMEYGRACMEVRVSPIDTGLFFAGAIVAREYFGDSAVTTLVNRLFHDVDWEWF